MFAIPEPQKAYEPACRARRCRRLVTPFLTTGLLLLYGALPASATQVGDVVVKITGSESQAGTGFVFLIREDVAYVLTAFHVVRDFDLENRFQVAFPHSDGRYYGRVRFPYPLLDLAVLALDRYPAGIGALRLGHSRTISAGASVYTYGYPGGGRIQRDDGTVSSLSGGRVYLDDITPDFGNSGGPVLDAETHRVVGMIVQKSTGQAQQYAVSVDQIRASVEDDLVFATNDPGVAIVPIDATLIGSVDLRSTPTALSEQDARTLVFRHGFYCCSILGPTPFRTRSISARDAPDCSKVSEAR